MNRSPVVHSVRRRLLVTLLVVVGPIVIALAGVLYLAVERSVWNRFDAELIELGDTVGELVEFDHEDGYELELGARPQPLTRALGQRTYLELWDPEGRLLSRTAGLDTALPQPQPLLGVTPARLASGEPVRIVVREFVPRVDDQAPAGLAPPGPVTLVLARETATTRAMLTRLASWFVGLALVTLGLAMFAAWWAVRRGLEPLARVAAAVEEIGVDEDRELSRRIDLGPLPSELRPTVARVNALLDRLEQALRHERQLTADVAHELRTPLSVLRTELELSLRRERSNAEYRASQAAALETAVELAGLVDNLLLLARLDHAAAPEPSVTRFDLAELVEACWATQVPLAEARGLRFELALAHPSLESDREGVRLVIANLLANAAQYTEAGGWVRVEDDRSAGVLVAVVDSGPPLSAADQARVFERFWRADDARVEAGAHCGIGLALARASCERLGWTLAVESRGTACAFVVSRR